jgi:heat shock protein HslJ
MWRKTFAAAAALGLAALMPRAGIAQSAEGALTASGNEPFWRVEVSGPDFLLSRLGFPDLALSVVERTTSEEGMLVIRAASSSPALGAVLSLGPGPCADTMADQTYPFTAEVVLEDTVLSGCGGDPRALLSAVETWIVESLAGEAVLPETEVTLSFDAEDRLSGSAGCNRFTALYTITGEGLSIGPAAATRMACPEPIMAQEMRVFELLEAVVSFDIREDGGLSLVTRDGDRIEARAP